MIKHHGISALGDAFEKDLLIPDRQQGRDRDHRFNAGLAEPARRLEPGIDAAEGRGEAGQLIPVGLDGDLHAKRASFPKRLELAEMVQHEVAMGLDDEDIRRRLSHRAQQGAGDSADRLLRKKRFRRAGEKD